MPATDELVKFQLDEASATLNEAQALTEQELHRGALNRCYYAMFYAALALLATKNLSASKHSGVIAIFNQEFVKTGVFPKDLAKAFVTAFDLRNKTDYRDFVEANPEQTEPLLRQAQSFVGRVRELAEQ